MSSGKGTSSRKGTMSHLRRRSISLLALFTSGGTLLCCALPVAIAVIAGSAAVGSLVSAFPWLVPLSRHKGWVFVAAGVLLTISGFLTLRPTSRIACTIGGDGCEVAGKFTRVTFWVSAAMYALGAFAAYGLVPMLRLLERSA